MRRVRRVSTEPAAFRRLAAALLLSGGLHLVLIYGIVLPAGPGAATQWSVIHARLQPPTAAKGAALKLLRRLPARTMIPPAAAKAVPEQSEPRKEPVDTEQVAVPAGDLDRDAMAVSFPEAGKSGSSPVPDLVHYPAKELDVYPQAVTPIAPLYPPDAATAQRAAVTLRVLIDDAGRVVETSVVDATAGPAFEHAAMQALARAAFHPAQRQGRAVRSQLLIKVEFDAAAANAGR